MPTPNLKRRARKIFAALRKLHPQAHIELNYTTPFELLVATILSAQCTDVRVNLVTERLFKKFTTPRDYISRPVEELEELIQSAGFFRQKAKSIRGCAAAILDIHGGKVPSSMDELVQLPGVGRKTANVVLGNAFKLPGLPVDTHVIRISNRLGLTSNSDPVKIESDLHQLFEPEDWCLLSHTLIFHGRRICKARKPECKNCTVRADCVYYQENFGAQDV